MKRLAGILLSLALLLSACRDARVATTVATPVSPSVHGDRPRLEVGLIGATSGGSGLSAQRALQGARLAFDGSNATGTLPVDVIGVAQDTQEDPATTLSEIQALAADPSVVAIVAWPSPAELNTVVDAAKAAGLPLIVVSPAEAVPPSSTEATGWSRMVATDHTQAEADAAYIAGVLAARRACVTGDDLPRSTSLMQWEARQLELRGVRVALSKTVLPQQSDYQALTSSIVDAGCDAVFWAGGGTEAGLIRSELTDAGRKDVGLVGIDTLIGEPFLEAAAGAADGTVASCPCRDISSMTSLDVQRFIQDYQSKYGNPPSVYSVEGWDAAGRILAALAAGHTDRAGIGAHLAKTPSYDGLAGTYRFNADGSSNGVVTFYEVRNDGWTSLGAARRVIEGR